MKMQFAKPGLGGVKGQSFLLLLVNRLLLVAMPLLLVQRFAVSLS